jgi:uncharacterized protein with GYD domain
MARYLFQASYTSEAWAVQVSNPQNRIDAIRSVIERLGGRLESAFLSFGDYDVVVIAEMPDAISAAAFSLATSAGGALKAIKTTPLLTIEEGMEAMHKAAGAGYRPPGRL